jgi:hypothetical protein
MTRSRKAARLSLTDAFAGTQSHEDTFVTTNRRSSSNSRSTGFFSKLTNLFTTVLELSTKDEINEDDAASQSQRVTYPDLQASQEQADIIQQHYNSLGSKAADKRVRFADFVVR